MADHVHLLVELPPQCSLSDVVRNLKISSSKWICEHISGHLNFSWQKGYGAFAVSESNKAPVAKYIQTQEQHHQKYSFKDEFLALLRKQNVQFDEKYLWK